MEAKFNISSLADRLGKEYGTVVLLESQKLDHPASERSLIASDPQAWIKVYGDQVVLFEQGKQQVIRGNSWDQLSAFRERNPDWVVGFLGYNLKNHTEELRSENEVLCGIPDLFFFTPGVLFEVNEQNELKRLKGDTEAAVTEAHESSALSVSLRKINGKEEYLSKIREAQKRITDGEFYEINLSHPLIYDFEGEPIDLYRKMKQAGPVPFASFIHSDGYYVCCSSPERFLSKKGEQVWSQPIKGTVSREINGGQEEISALVSEKNKAENLMIVDLVRNDLNRVSIPGSVKVSNLFEVQTFDTVHQMVSTISSRVDPSADPVSIIRSCFPMGSMTGAPKIASMKAIEELEDYNRGLYSGAIGYIDPAGDFDFNVVIRTAIVEDKTLIYPVGGAITSDSDPDDEWQETLIKARALNNVI